MTILLALKNSRDVIIASDSLVKKLTGKTQMQKVFAFPEKRCVLGFAGIMPLEINSFETFETFKDYLLAYYKQSNPKLNSATIFYANPEGLWSCEVNREKIRFFEIEGYAISLPVSLPLNYTCVAERLESKLKIDSNKKTDIIRNFKDLLIKLESPYSDTCLQLAIVNNKEIFYYSELKSA